MKIDSKKDNSWWIFLSVVFTIMLFILGVFTYLIDNKDAILTLTSFFQIFLHNKFLWIFFLLIIIIPIIINFAMRKIQSNVSLLESKIFEQERQSKDVTNYIEGLINENYDIEIEENNENILAKSLVNLRKRLKSNKELVDQQRRDDERRNWHAEGHAKFGGILRDNTDFEKLAFNVIKELTNYIDAIQGGFFHLEEEVGEKYYDLIAFYAYGRKKFANKKLGWGKGLIGTAGIEMKTIHMEKLPQGYISVTSGLGQANPKEVLVCPLIYEGQLFGVIEIATLNSFTKDHVDFAEKVAESTASTLSSVRMNIQTKKLLDESKQQAQTLASQEEEMRQNMEELKATQEEAARQANKFLRLENTVNHTMIRAEYNMDGILLYANLNFLKKLEYSSNSQVEGKHISMFVSKKDEEWFNNIWLNLEKGGRHFEGYMKHITKTGKDLWTMATYTCIRDDEGEAERVLFLALDTTEQKKLSLNLEAFMNAVDRSNINLEFNTSGNLTKYNEHFLYVFKYTDKEALTLNINDLINPLELDSFNKKWESIVNGINFDGNFKVQLKGGQEGWLQGAFSAVYNQYGEIDRVIMIGKDITSQKMMEIEFKNQNEVLKKQEKLLRESEKELSIKLKEAKLEMKDQFKEIEAIKIRNERTLEGALDAIVQTSNDGKIIFYNKAAEDLLGYKKNEVMGKEIGLLFSEDTKLNDDFVSNYIAPNKEKTVGVRTEIKLKPKDEEELSVLCLLSKAQVDREITYTAFIQTIEVELF